MTEREYIDATNLAKIRAAKTVLRDALPMDGAETSYQQAALQAMRDWEERLEKVTKTRG